MKENTPFTVQGVSFLEGETLKLENGKITGTDKNIEALIQENAVVFILSQEQHPKRRVSRVLFEQIFFE